MNQQEEETSWLKKTREHLEAEKNRGRGTKDCQKRIVQAKKEVHSQSNTAGERENIKSKQTVCQALYCESEGGTTSDRQKWKEELERYSRNKYQDDEMKKKAKKELDEWDERDRRCKERDGGSQGPRLTVSVLMQSRASFSNEKAVKIDGISAEILKFIPWSAVQKIRKAFEMRYPGQNKEEIEAWLRNIIVLIPKKKTMTRLEGQTRRICVHSVLAK